MERRFYRELWNLRFRKMLQMEKKSIVDYTQLLRECRVKFKGSTLIPHLEKLIKDEKKHAKLVQELIRILNRQS